MKSLGERIYEARLAKGLNQVELAAQVGVSTSVVSFWENDKSKPRERNLERLEEALGQLGPPTIGDWLRGARENQNLTVRELSKRSGVASLTISNIENGNSNPQQKTIDKLENVLRSEVPEETVEELEDTTAIHGVSDAELFDPYDPDTWPRVGGVYVLYDKSKRPAYIGQSNRISRRIRDHSEKRWYIEPLVQSGKFVQIEDTELRKSVERALIRLLDSYALVNRHLAIKEDEEEE